jgi:hypothetical protein
MTDDPTPEQRNYAAAIRAHEMFAGTVTEGFKAVISAAGSALRVLLTINAGGIISLLGFIGAIAGREKHLFASSEIFIPPMTSFAAGLILSAAASCFMYLAQWFFGMAGTKQTLDFTHPYIHGTAVSRNLRVTGLGFQGLTLGAALGGFVAFVVGLWRCRDIILGVQL